MVRCYSRGMSPSPDPTPSPLVVQLVTDNQTPWWWTGALTGFFVLLAAFVAFMSLRASDKRKLSREDRRQWDSLIKDGFVTASTLIDELVALHTLKGKLHMPDASPDEAERAQEIVASLYATANEFDLIANEATGMAMFEVAIAAKAVEFNLSHGIHTSHGHLELVTSSQNLIAEVKKNLRITK